MEKLEKRFLHAVGTKDVCKILELISEKSCSATMLSKELGIPMVSSYRKLKALEDAKFVYCAKIIINHSGNEEKFYSSSVNDATIKFHEGIFSVELHQKENCKTILKIWGN